MESATTFYLRSVLLRTPALRRPSPSPSLNLPHHRYWCSVSQNQWMINLAAARKDGQDHGVGHSFPIVQKADGIKMAPQTPFSYLRKLSSWAKWLVGLIVISIYPYWKKQSQQFRQIEGEVETVIEKVEDIMAVVEKVASVTEKIASEVADSLPSEGKLKEAALIVEHFSQEVKKDAEIAIEIIHEVSEETKEIETVIEKNGDSKDEGK